MDVPETDSNVSMHGTASTIYLACLPYMRTNLAVADQIKCSWRLPFLHLSHSRPNAQFILR